MKTNIGSILSAFTVGAVLLGVAGTDNVSAAQAAGAAAVDEGPSGSAPAAVLAKLEQIPVSTGVKATATPLLVDATASCPRGMVEVEGDYCSHVEQRCLRWLDPDTKMRCAEFAPAPIECQGKSTHKHFCIDQFEYPNEPGQKPLVMKTWYEAKNACTAQGKRLCGETEWTLACEGQERLPYPYGYARNAEACNIDKAHPDVDEAAIANPATRAAEVERLWQGEPSGAREACVSPYGVHDMAGNVDEWVVNESGHPFKSGLKGGYWGPVRTRCRPMTTAHNEEFSFYQIGFRCCADDKGTTTPAAKPGDLRGAAPSINQAPATAPGPAATPAAAGALTGT